MEEDIEVIKELRKQGLISDSDILDMIGDDADDVGKSKNHIKSKPKKKRTLKTRKLKTKWSFPPTRKIVKKVLDNKHLFVGHEIDYMENNSVTPIKNRDGYVSPDDIEQDSMIEEKMKEQYRKWAKKKRKKKTDYDPVKYKPLDPVEKYGQNNGVRPMMPEEERTVPMMDQNTTVPMIENQMVSPTEAEKIDD